MKKIIMLTVIAICVIMFIVGCKNGYESIVNETSGKVDADNLSDIANNSVDDNEISSNESGEMEFSGDENLTFVEENCEYNESGQIIIVMYHKFANEEKDEYTRSFDNFYKDLEYLYEHNYRTVSLNDYLNNTMKVPVGMTPIIFTFDDSVSSQFSFVKNESGELEVNPNTAVAIMEKFYNEHPDFGLNGTFFINGNSIFGGVGTTKEKLEYLVSKGFEIGNHTYSHVDFSKMTPEKIQEEIGKVNNLVESVLDGYKITALALPYGISSKEYKDYIAKGSYDGISYDNKIILLVGWKPTVGPNNENLNLLSLPRVRARGGNKAVDCDLYYWLEIMEKNPKQKYERLK